MDIKVIDERNPYFLTAQGGLAPQMTPSVQVTAPSAPPLLKGDRVPLENFIFDGASVLKSVRGKNELSLVNSSVATFARANLYWDPPKNLETSKIIFYARGQKGGENITLSLKDTNNVMAFEKGRMNPFEGGLTTEWQMAEISLENAVKEFNPKKASSLRFDFGSKDAKNKPGDTVFVKDIQVVSL